MASKELTKEETEILSKLRDQYGDIAAFKTKDGRLAAIRGCTPMERTRLLSELADTKKPDMAGAHKTFARSVMVWPELQEDRDAILGSYPFLCEKYTNRSIELSEGEAVEVGKF
jgi:hypothetical protein